MQDNPLIRKLKIKEVIVETQHARTLVLEPQDGWLPVFQPGQFITLVFNTVHGEKRRSFSLISNPGEPLMITVKKIDNGEFSRPLVYESKPGDILFSSGISGVFVLPTQPEKLQHCFLAAGSGITPCYALIRFLLSTTEASIVLFYSNKNSDDAIFFDQIKTLQEQYSDRFKVRFLFSDHSDLYYKRLSKWLLERLLDEYIHTDIESTRFYLCGPYEYMQMAEIVLLNRTSRSNIIKESFSSLPRMVLPEPPDKDMHQVTLKINESRYTIDVKYPDTVLKAAKRQNIVLPYSCEAGRCAACIATCTKGKVWMAYNEVLVDEEVRRGRILTCQAFPVGGDIEIVFDQIDN